MYTRVPGAPYPAPPAVRLSSNVCRVCADFAPIFARRRGGTVRLPQEVMIVVRRGSEFLILHRAPRFDAYWHVVAGAVEAGESSPEAAARELLEETGLAAELVDLERRYVYPLSEES